MNGGRLAEFSSQILTVILPLDRPVELTFEADSSSTSEHTRSKFAKQIISVFKNIQPHTLLKNNALKEMLAHLHRYTIYVINPQA